MNQEWLIEQWFGEHRVLTREDFQAIKGLCGMVKEAKKPARMVEFETMSGLKVRFKTRRKKAYKDLTHYQRKRLRATRHAYYLKNISRWKAAYAKKKQAVA